MVFSKLIANKSKSGLPHDSESPPILPSELIYEILQRLTVRTLLRLKCVSKSWHSLNSSSKFVDDHLKLSTNNQEFAHHNFLWINDRNNFLSFSLNAIMHEEPPDSVPTNEFLEMDQSSCPYIVLGPCNGLFCISDSIRHTFIWNPSIREITELPLSLHHHHAYGFGYDEQQNDYKLGSITTKKLAEQGFLNVVNFYSLRTNSWQKVLEFSSVTLYNFGEHVYFVNGRLHWNVWSYSKANNNISRFIFSLDVKDKTYNNVSFPNITDKFGWYLRILGGKLCLFYDYWARHDQLLLDVWVLEYGVEPWIKVVSIPIDHGCSPIFIFPNDEILLQNYSTLLLYNWKNCSSKRSKLSVDFDVYGHLCMYIRSLVSPKSVIGFLKEPRVDRQVKDNNVCSSLIRLAQRCWKAE